MGYPYEVMKTKLKNHLEESVDISKVRTVEEIVKRLVQQQQADKVLDCNNDQGAYCMLELNRLRTTNLHGGAKA